MVDKPAGADRSATETDAGERAPYVVRAVGHVDPERGLLPGSTTADSAPARLSRWACAATSSAANPGQ